MTRFFVLGLIAVTLTAGRAGAQQAAPPAPQTAVVTADTLRALPELQNALDELAATLDRLGRRIANDPELRVSAVRAAQSFVGVAQIMVEQQTALLNEALKTAAERIAAIPVPATPAPRH